MALSFLGIDARSGSRSGKVDRDMEDFDGSFHNSKIYKMGSDTDFHNPWLDGVLLQMKLLFFTGLRSLIFLTGLLIGTAFFFILFSSSTGETIRFIYEAF